jgi:hypothetical protein
LVHAKVHEDFNVEHPQVHEEFDEILVKSLKNLMRSVPCPEQKKLAKNLTKNGVVAVLEKNVIFYFVKLIKDSKV